MSKSFVQELIKSAGGALDAQADGNKTPAHICAEKGNIKALELLFEKVPDSFAVKDSRGRKPEDDANEAASLFFANLKAARAKKDAEKERDRAEFQQKVAEQQKTVAQEQKKIAQAAEKEAQEERTKRRGLQTKLQRKGTGLKKMPKISWIFTLQSDSWQRTARTRGSSIFFLSVSC